MYRYVLVFLLTLLMLTSVAHAQVQPPDNRNQALDTVLQNLSERMGRTITTGNLTYQEWQFGSYNFVRGDCIGAPTVEPIAGGWQRYELTYQNTIFSYLISDTLTNIILCNEAAMPSAQSTAIPPATTVPLAITATSIPSNAAQDFQPLPTVTRCPLPTRLSIGGLGRVTPGDPNWVHVEPRRSSAKIGEIPGEETFTVIGSPICDETTGMNFWQIDYQNTVGFTSEGLNGEYWIEPFVPQESGITRADVSTLTVPRWSRLVYPEGTVLSVSSSTQQIAISYSDEDVIRIINLDDPTTISTIPKRINDNVTALAFGQDASVFVIGYASGIVDLGGGINSQTPINVNGIITSIAVANGLIFVGDSLGILSIFEDTGNQTPLRTFQLNEPAGAFEFSNQGDMLIVRSTQGAILLILQGQN